MVVGLRTVIFTYLVFLTLRIVKKYVPLYMFKVYFDKISICISSTRDDTLHKMYPFRISTESDIIGFVTNLQDDKFDGDIALYGLDAKIIFRYLASRFINIEAAGGVVTNTNDSFLIIKRLGIWDLPKGKVESNESYKEAAIREVCEETGITSVQIVGDLPNTFHIYRRKKKWYLKKTSWYKMINRNDEKLIPQTAEDISDATWMNKTDARNAISKSYRSIREELGYIVGL